MSGAIAVSGVGGFVGGRLVDHLRSEGHDVRALSRRPVPWLPATIDLDLATASPDAIAEALVGCQAVVHLAGASEVVAAAEPDRALASTAAAARRTAAAASIAGVERFVYLSTIHVYGAALDRVDEVDERTVPEPRHPYAVARLAGEHLCAAAALPSLVVLRLTNCVGAPLDARVDRWSLVANDLCAQAAAGGPLRLTSSGRQRRDFIDLGEACRIIAAAASGTVPAGTYNLGSGQQRTVLDLAELVAEVAASVLGVRPSVEAPPHVGPIPRLAEVDISRLAEHVAPPAVPLERSLRELIELCGRSGAGRRTER